MTNRKHTPILAAILCLLLLSAGCSGPVPSNGANTQPPDGSGSPSAVVPPPSAQPAPTPEPTPDYLRVIPHEKVTALSSEEVKAMVRRHADKSESEPIDVPVYWKDSIIDMTSGRYRHVDPGYDNGLYTIMHPNSQGNWFTYFLKCVPTEAIRLMDDGGYCYLMYDTEQGQRIYVFSTAGCFVVAGVPVLMEKKLSYADFSGVKKGMEISELIAIDPVMAIYREYFYREVVPYDLAVFWPEYEPYTTVSVLADGALKLTFVLDKGQLLVDTITFNKDFLLEGCYETICYRIAEADYQDNP